MSIGDSITLIGCLAGLTAALPALLVFLNTIFTRTTERAAHRLAYGRKLPLLTGILMLIIIGGPGLVLLSMGSIFQLIGTLIIFGLLLWAFAGLGAVARLVGYRLSEMGNRDSNSITEVLSGAVVLTFAIAFPLVGWVIIFPVGLVLGIGATTLSLFKRTPVETHSEDVPVMEAAGD